MTAKLARPYAKAAFEYAVEHQRVDQWSAMLQTMAKFIADPKVAAWLNNPTYGADKRIELCFALGQDVLDDAGRNFIKLLATNHRLTALPEIAEQFAQLRAAVEATLQVQVKSATPLSTDYQQQLKQLLNTKFNRHIQLQCEVDESLLGGLVILAGDHVIDGSIKGQLQRLRAAITN